METKQMRYEATEIAPLRRSRLRRFAIRPAGTLGTCGWINGEAWSVVYVNARSAPDAMLKFHCSRGTPVVEQRE